MELISSKLNVDFLGKKYFAFFLSAIMIGLSVYTWIDIGDAKYGIDYKGGHEIIVKTEAGITSEGIRKALSDGGVENSVVQSFEAGSSEFAIRLGGQATEEGSGLDESKKVRESITNALGSAFPGKVEIIKTDFVGPTIGKELCKKALVAVVIGLIGILGYITFRFEFAFALGAVAALFHDVIVSMGIYLLCGFSISVATLAAALTIVGYSVNDTIIVFDRMREEIFKQKNYELVDLMNRSINSTLSRTVITSLLTLFSALALLIFGGGAIADLSLFLVVGVITGTYSTIFIASPVALAWENFRNPVKADELATESK